MVLIGEYISREFTVSDSAAPLTSLPWIFVELDLQVHDNTILKGDVNSQTLELAALDTQSFRVAKGVDFRKMFFVNKTADAAHIGTVTVDGVLKD